jgi:myb proto-oncogene protein
MHFQFLNLRRGRPRSAWTSEEDRLLVGSIEQEGVGRWNEVAKRLFYDSGRRLFRSPKHCRERWLNHLDMNKKRGDWTTREDYLIFKYALQHGKRWCKIVPLLEYTRTEHMIKNRYNSLLAKNMTNRKQREEDVAGRMCRNLLKSLEKELPVEKPSSTKLRTSTSLSKIEELSVD